MHRGEEERLRPPDSGRSPRSPTCRSRRNHGQNLEHPPHGPLRLADQSTGRSSSGLGGGQHGGGGHGRRVIRTHRRGPGAVSAGLPRRALSEGSLRHFPWQLAAVKDRLTAGANRSLRDFAAPVAEFATESRGDMSCTCRVFTYVSAASTVKTLATMWKTLAHRKTESYRLQIETHASTIRNSRHKGLQFHVWCCRSLQGCLACGGCYDCDLGGYVPKMMLLLLPLLVFFLIFWLQLLLLS